MQGTLTPAFGRDYKNIRDLKHDWANNRDFVLNATDGAGYVNNLQCTELFGEGCTLQARYANNTKVVMVTCNMVEAPVTQEPSASL